MAEYYKLEIANWNVGTDDLNLEQEAAYFRVVGMIRLYEQPLKHNLKVLCGIWRCNERKAKRLLQELIDAGKLSIEDGLIVNEKAVNDASTLRQSRVDRASRGRLGGIESGKSRRKALENIEVVEVPALTREEKNASTEAKIIDDGDDERGREVPRPSNDDFFLSVLHAAGITNGHIPARWMPPTAMLKVSRWKSDLGLSENEIMQVITASRANNKELAGGPEAFERGMKTLAGEKMKAPLTPSMSENNVSGMSTSSRVLAKLREELKKGEKGDE